MQNGRKTILGIRQGATENATVVGELLGDLVNRGLDFTEPRLYVLDGGKALRANIDETILLVLITEQGENRNQCEKQWISFGFPHGFARGGTKGG